MRHEFLQAFLDHPPERVALTWEGVDYSFGALREMGERAAGWLRIRNVQPGDRVCIQLENSVELLAAHLGCMALGAIRVPLNAHYKAAEVAPIVEDSQPQLVITKTPKLFKGQAVATEVGAAQRQGDWAEDGATALLFTSGTTGRPKGVPQTWDMWTSNLRALERRWQLGPDDHLWLTLPLFHTHGLVLGLHGCLLRGARCTLSSRFDPVEPPSATHFYGVPTYYRRWLPLMQSRPELFAGFKLMVSGSDGLPAELSDAVFAAIGQRLLERYGMTETVMIASNPFHGERRAGTVGTPLDGTEVRIVEGEVQVRGESVFAGYWPVGDDKAFTADGFFRTGDAGDWDEKGYLRIVGRKKDLVIVGGVNVSPAEVERVLGSVKGVAEVGCCGLPDTDLNEVVAAAVVPDGTVPEAALRSALEARAQELSGLKRPRRYAFVESLPKNALGKLQRGRLPGEVFSG